MSEKSLNECPDLFPFEPSHDIDPFPSHCPDDCAKEPSQKQIPFLEDVLRDKKGIGEPMLCDPMTTGQVVNDLSKLPNRNTIYRYSKGLRGCDEGMLKLFNNIVVIDEQGVTHPVPIIWGTQERAVMAALSENVRKDTTLAVDHIRLPIMAIHSQGYSPNFNRYTYHEARYYFRGEDRHPRTLTREKRNKDTVFGIARGIPIDISYQLGIWTYFTEDMNQILEQIATKFSMIAYIKVQGVHEEVIVKLDSIENNNDYEPGSSNRVVKFQIGMTAETFIPQPIRRDKTVLKTRVDFVDGITENDIIEVLSRIEQEVE